MSVINQGIMCDDKRSVVFLAAYSIIKFYASIFSYNFSIYGKGTVKYVLKGFSFLALELGKGSWIDDGNA